MQDRNKQIVKYSIFGIFVNLFLSLIKVIVGLLAMSIAVVLDAINNFTDALSSIITIIGIKLSEKKPDKKHPYGHGRIEYLTSLIIGVIILISALLAGYESIQKIVEGGKPEYQIYSLIIIAVGVLTKLFFGLFIKKKGKELNAGSLKAAGTDALSDALLSSTVLIGALITYFVGVSIEGYLGVLISIFILKAAISILLDSFNDVIGKRATPEEINALIDEIAKYDEVLGVYDIIMHNYGPNKTIATAHIQVQDFMTAYSIHQLTRLIQIDVYQKLGITLTIGIYASNDNEKYQVIKKDIFKMKEIYSSILQIHGFYVNEQIKLITFDLVFDFDETNKNQIIADIKAKLQNKYPDYNYSIIVDTDYSL